METLQQGDTPTKRHSNKETLQQGDSNKEPVQKEDALTRKRANKEILQGDVFTSEIPVKTPERKEEKKKSPSRYTSLRSFFEVETVHPGNSTPWRYRGK